jgi:D-amino-acid oxidase
MARDELDAVVIGAGVIGLTTAVCLAEAGRRVEVWTAEPPTATTSAAAGAMWGPYLVEPRDRIRRWSQHTIDVLTELAQEPDTGVRLVRGVEASRTAVEPPDWAELVPDLAVCDSNELPNGFVSGWEFTVPIADMTAYLPYVIRRLEAAGGTMQVRRVGSLMEAGAVAPVAVNCAGMGARTLAADSELYPIRGQLVVVENPGLSEFFSEDTGTSSELLCIYPQGDTVVLGGTAEPNVWERTPDMATAERILARCAEVEPRLKNARVVGHRVGLRPTRPAVRVEVEERDGLRIIHNYGHGGAGVSLSWGCGGELTGLMTTNSQM